MEKKEAMICICCPQCGGYNGRSMVAKSEIICRKCNQLFTVNVSDGVLTMMSVERTEIKTK